MCRRPVSMFLASITLAVVLASCSGGGHSSSSSTSTTKVAKVTPTVTTTTIGVPAQPTEHDVTTATIEPYPYTPKTVKVAAWGQKAYGTHWSDDRMSLRAIKNLPGGSPDTTKTVLELCSIDDVGVDSVQPDPLVLVRPAQGFLPNQDGSPQPGDGEYFAEGTIYVSNANVKTVRLTADNPDYSEDNQLELIKPAGTCSEVTVEVFTNTLADTYVGFGGGGIPDGEFGIEGEFTRLGMGQPETVLVYDTQQTY